MGMIVLVVGTVELLLLQGRVVVILMDMDMLGVDLLGLLGLEHNQQEGVGGGLMPVEVSGGMAEGDFQPLLVVWHGVVKL